jgi:hypothetical protein
VAAPGGLEVALGKRGLREAWDLLFFGLTTVGSWDKVEHMTSTPIADSSPLVPFSIPRHPGPISFAQARIDLPPEVFRDRLRRHLLDYPGLTLAQVGRELGVTRQRVGLLVGRLNRPSCAQPSGPARPAPKKQAALRRMAELSTRVQAGESAESAAAALGVSLAMAAKLGFRTRAVRPPHGRGRVGCECWRCRAAGGRIRRRGRRAAELDPAQAVLVADWLAWVDPDSGAGLPLAEVARLVGVGVGAVGRSVGGVA